MKATKWIAVWATGMIALAGWAWGQTMPAAIEGYKIEETRLGPMDAQVLSPVFSSDGRHFAYVTHRGDDVFVVVDGHANPAHDGVVVGTLIFSPDGSRVAYAVYKGGKQLMIVDGKEGAEYDEIIKKLSQNRQPMLATVPQ